MPLSEQERKESIENAKAMLDAFDNGDDDAFYAAAREMKAPADALMACKKVNGADWIKEMGLDTSRADQEYGKDWLNK